MTDTGIEEIKKRIAEKTVYTPSDFDLDKLGAWVDGYRFCMDAVMDILDEFKDGR